MPTVGEELIRRYHTLQQSCEKKIGQFPLPKVGEVDASDVFMIVLNYFHNQPDRRTIIQKYAMMKGIDSDLIEKVYPDIEDFLDWVSATLKRTNL